ncbi:Ig-like domain-containing protein [Planomicrobium sp. CPCC 101110]|uniref:Ig-like domain-containing protein n=1 Tax=Planomicrobium sp. CPCC 101110 TaxID=2599619 RepID=UPI0011B7AC1D|nr:Ig-like domain-containing protein [Planomicrobium sp. CPCC 101110]TWT27799.1 Ig domain-containing protein [Planomicrobium sp. CPCC 101110]
MKKNIWIKVLFLLVLLLSFFVGNSVQAEEAISLSEGTYTVGNEISAGLNKFKVVDGLVRIEVYRDQKGLITETVNSYKSDQINLSLKLEDRVDVYFIEDTTPALEVEMLAKADLNALTVGYYEIGSDIPAGTYLLDIDKPLYEDDDAYIFVLDSEGNQKQSIEVYENSEPIELKLVTNEYIYISNLAGTMSFKEKNIVPASIKFSKSGLSITPDQTYRVTATVFPSNAMEKTIVWKSSNTKVATVDASGNIKGIAKGTAKITATATGNSEVTKTLNVNVSSKKVKLNKTSLSLRTGKAGTLSATVSPVDSKDKMVAWKSSNTKIATVDSKGKVTGKAKGTVTITASVKNGKSATMKVTVTPPIAAKSAKMNKASATVKKGKTFTLSATVSPSNTTNKTLKWKSSNTKVAKVDSKGKVTAVGVGTAKITATTTNGKTTTATITVPYSKTLSAGTWKGGHDLPAGRYKITTTSDFGNIYITSNSYDRDVIETLASDKEYGVTAITTDIKAGDKIEIEQLNNVQFTKVPNVKSNVLHAGYWTVGKDINAGKYKITTTDYVGNLFISRGEDMFVIKTLMNDPEEGAVGSVTTTLKNGDRIHIESLNKVIFTKK